MKKRTKMFIIIGVVMIPLAIFVIRTRIPIKYAIKIEDVGQYPNCIIVREAWHTGTGWEQIGNEQGYLTSDKINDVYLVGDLPPSASIGGEHVNSYLCKVANLGQDVFPAIGDAELFDKYEVLEWHPIYPVKRDTLLPSWFYPQDYISKSDRIQ